MPSVKNKFDIQGPKKKSPDDSEPWHYGDKAFYGRNEKSSREIHIKGQLGDSRKRAKNETNRKYYYVEYCV